MSLLLLSLLVIALLTAGYLLYGSFIARQYNLDDANATPATVRNDGVDFVPTRPFYLLGQHFSAIAAAGPIVGPVLACLAFGWLPCILWIVLGVILIGAVHDFSALVASVRHGAHSVAEIARRHLGRRAYLCMVGFIWLALLYVIVAFTEVTAATFVGVSEEIEGIEGVANRGGAVAAASVMYLGLALVMGLVQRFLRPPMWLSTLIFVPATLGVIYLGTRISTVLVFDIGTWEVAILAYCFVASLVPLWLLQQPRGYLGGFVLYLAIAVGVLGLLAGNFTVQQPATKPLADYGAFFAGGENAPNLTSLIFPFLFVTIACGACSGFHGLVCGGTTSRQIAKESHCKPIGFGAMLLEGFVAVIALATVMVATQADLQITGADGITRPKPPGAIYGEGLARFITVFTGGGAEMLFVATTFGTMAVATFIFDTLDVSTRLGRYLLQELTGTTGRLAGAIAAGATAGVPLLILLVAERGSYLLFWTLFGTSNQLLASLTLLGITVWLYRSGKRCWYTALPTAFVMTITLTALALQIFQAGRAAVAGEIWTAKGMNPVVMNGIVGVALLGFAAVFIGEAVRSVRAFHRERLAAPSPAPPPTPNPAAS